MANCQQGIELNKQGIKLNKATDEAKNWARTGLELGQGLRWRKRANPQTACNLRMLTTAIPFLLSFFAICILCRTSFF
jgi:hypothetical protein